ncbi:MAG: hypothetical protein ACYCYP_08335 [Leptospirales bacterium]
MFVRQLGWELARLWKAISLSWPVFSDFPRVRDRIRTQKPIRWKESYPMMSVSLGTALLAVALATLFLRSVLSRPATVSLRSQSRKMGVRRRYTRR